MYTWKEGRSHPVGANVVGKAVDRIIKRDGVCKPLALVEAARPDDSPLHPLFEWRNDAAAEKWRTDRKSVV